MSRTVIFIVSCVFLLTAFTAYYLFQPLARRVSPIGSTQITSTNNISNLATAFPSLIGTNNISAKNERTPETISLDQEMKWREVQGRNIPEPKLFKYTGSPETPDQQAMWDWWHKMGKIDPRFVYRRPIEFYGKVVDENGQPIPDAGVSVNISNNDGYKDYKMKTDSYGFFSVKNEKGKSMTIGVGKSGYSRRDKSNGTYEYAEFFSDKFYIPDPNNPVIFVLPKLVK